MDWHHIAKDQIALIQEKLTEYTTESEQLLIAIDGRDGAGKTNFSKFLGKEFG